MFVSGAISGVSSFGPEVRSPAVSRIRLLAPSHASTSDACCKFRDHAGPARGQARELPPLGLPRVALRCCGGLPRTGRERAGSVDGSEHFLWPPTSRGRLSWGRSVAELEGSWWQAWSLYKTSCASRMAHMSPWGFSQKAYGRERADGAARVRRRFPVGPERRGFGHCATGEDRRILKVRSVRCATSPEQGEWAKQRRFRLKAPPSTPLLAIPRRFLACTSRAMSVAGSRIDRLRMWALGVAGGTLPIPASVVFDFLAAAPSIYHNFLVEARRRSGAPERRSVFGRWATLAPSVSGGSRVARLARRPAGVLPAPGASGVGGDRIVDGVRWEAPVCVVGARLGRS